MKDTDTKRISRLTAILTQLQTKRLITASDLSKRYKVSIRTIYRDVKVLEQAGIPIITEEGRGYALQDGFRLPPVMFTEDEANALITAGKLIATNKDASLVKSHSAAIDKIKSVLKLVLKDKTEFLSSRIQFRHNLSQYKTSSDLMALQLAITNYQLCKIEYQSLATSKITRRIIEPFALYSTQENWLLIAWCQLRKEYRSFRLDNIKQMIPLNQAFKPHTLTLQAYFEICRKKQFENQSNP
jgi:predicted DNA-binding transcriptional regulator YafY